jgi:hypothetical protein
VLRRRYLALVVAAGLLAAACSSGDDDDAAGEPTTARATTTTLPAVYTATVSGETEVDPAYRQGVARVDDGWIFSLNDGLFRTDDSFAQTVVATPAIPPEWAASGFNHVGDIDVVGDVLYASLEQPDYDLGMQAMLRYDAATLQVIDGVDVAQHHNSFVTVDPETNIAYSMDMFGDSEILRYDVGDGWRVLEPITMSRFVDKVQGGDIADGAIWLSTDDDTEGVYRVDLATGEVQALGSIGHVDGEGEGIDATPRPSGDLHVLSIDVAVVPVRLISLSLATG